MNITNTKSALEWNLYKHENRRILRLLDAIEPLGKKMGSKYGVEGENRITLLERPDILAMIQIIERKDIRLYEEAKEKKPEYSNLAALVLYDLIYSEQTLVREYFLDNKERYNETERMFRTLGSTDLTELKSSDVIRHWIVNREKLHFFYVLVLYYLFVYYEFEDPQNLFSKEITHLNVTYANFLEYFKRIQLSENQEDTKTYIYALYTSLFKDCEDGYVSIRTESWRNIIGLILSQIGPVN